MTNHSIIASTRGRREGCIELKNLSIGYRKKVVASGLNATLKGGAMVCLLGPNGAGKSTLLRTLCAFQPTLGGELLLNGKNISNIASQELSKQLGVVLTDRVKVQGLTVRELVGMGRSPYTNFWGKLTGEDNRIVDEAIKRCGVTDLAERDSTTLSDGERQKVMIAKALAQQTPIILLDEPTAFLDFPSKVETMLLLQQLAHEEGKAILISTHDLDLALQTADELWLMGKERTQSDVAQSNAQPEGSHRSTDESKHEAQSQMQVGPPQLLAKEGQLERFFQSPNISFDAAGLRFTIKK